jgi:glycosyltransferase involved in cell wall biosynthesis
MDSWDQISVCVITLNEEKNLDRCLASVAPCGEIIVVDSGSTDHTESVARRHGARWFVHPWSGFAAQRRFAAEQADRPFILFLDADEWLGPGLRGEISRLLEHPDAGRRALEFRRISTFLGRQIRHGDWSNDHVVRLAPRGKFSWEGLEPHPYLLPDACETLRCRQPLHHFPYAGLEIFRKKSESYARIWAEEARARGLRGTRAVGVLRAAWRFFRGYLLKAGFLDGKAGWEIALQNTRMVYQKYVFLSRKAPPA